MSLKDLWILATKKNPKNISTKGKDEIELERRKIELEEKKAYVEMQKMQIEQLKYKQRQQEFERMKSSFLDDDDDDDDEDDDGLGEIGELLSPIIGRLGGIPVDSPSINQSPHPQTQTPDISDDDLREFIAKQDRKYILMAKKAPKSMVLQKAMTQGLTAEQAERGYKILMEEF